MTTPTPTQTPPPQTATCLDLSAAGVRFIPASVYLARLRAREARTG